ncbi:uncharacterized protein P174DRAFT_422953 [Aspergillus novofumigatus IBT 16806]|uniref:RNase H type-1 domain-containing protein n=1 Tax=Aspergillus novofumigatus (strain IBT 16806) TaxID=1392255 RepID=A0A2I1C2D8_ASPN1|nr:uncharacterized protein P174DRAFT_422953 [Aspergillus novofumigatus IBT 16806]PKX91807.1 hypothetical protein P174DRAFT_422953 [Aspergillus novofumigatus IBT 16806]
MSCTTGISGVAISMIYTDRDRVGSLTDWPLTLSRTLARTLTMATISIRMSGLLEWDLMVHSSHQTLTRMMTLCTTTTAPSPSPRSSRKGKSAERATSWIKGWVRNGWRTSSGTPAKNKDLWKCLLGWCEDAATTRAKTKLEFWRIPRGWNAKADGWAKLAADKDVKPTTFMKSTGYLI